jgi:hypothetical protein
MWRRLITKGEPFYMPCVSVLNGSECTLDGVCKVCASWLVEGVSSSSRLSCWAPKTFMFQFMFRWAAHTQHGNWTSTRKIVRM